ncbi:MAG: methionyl-tRNA formyltransferase [Anaerolineaceae bacterium]|jgi:methionyl-tRNA formyltransferase|nr:methionyl-tRNA formyltransferase [Anaerolineaceae bacterium]MDI9530637.1 methionyl-tRNA formyltransferase [Chloroflexota bacterium]HNZ16284.1 methionyl-tRNA formyltransferase [Anaerolineaceae bacterium]
MSVRIVFMGSPDFAIPSMEALHEKYGLTAVVTQPDRPAGRGRALTPCAVKKRALELGLPVLQPLSLRKLSAVTELAEFKPDLIVVAAFGQILPKMVLEMPAKGCVNVHASLLPRWRGASPIQAAIAAGDAETGVTLMLMNEGLDTGPILAQRKVPIRPRTNAEELWHQLAFLGAQTLIEILPSFLSGMLAPLPQDNSSSTYAPMIRKGEGELDFSMSAVELDRKVRAFHPWPGTFFILDGKRVKVLEAHVHDSFASEPGERFVVNGLPAVGTGESFLVFDCLQPEGKKPMSGQAFLNGQPGWLH